MSNKDMQVHTCNMCGQPFDFFDMQEDFGIQHYVGYGSRHDGEYIEAHFCCECFDKLFDIINILCANPIHQEVEEECPSEVN